MKTCVSCKISKETSSFNRSKNKDGLSSWCKECVSKSRMRSYYKNRSKERERGNARNAEAKRKNKQLLLDYLTSHPCVDCGETDPIVLEFDHVHGTKVDTIASMATSKFRWEPIAEEIAKCEVRCANCHRRKTFQQFGYRK